MATWHDVASARDEWVDAPYDEDGGDDLLTSLLASARDAVLAYGPVLEDESIIPEGWRVAQLMQTRNVWNSSKASPTGDFDGGQYGLSTFPLDWQVKALIRPKRGKPVIA